MQGIEGERRTRQFPMPSRHQIAADDLSAARTGRQKRRASMKQRIGLSLSFYRQLPLILCLFLLLLVFVIATEDDKSSCSSETGVCFNDDNVCDFYLAPSTIAGQGWGIFTAKALRKEAPLPSDVSIVISDFDEQMERFQHYNGTRHQTTKHKRKINKPILPTWMLENYHWSGIVTQSLWDADSVYVVSPGLGMVANAHPGLHNVNNDGCSDRAPLPRKHPQAGAISKYQEQSFSTTMNVPAGGELLINYGSDWYETTPALVSQPLEEDYKAANDLLNLWEAVMDSVDSDISDPMARDLWEEVIGKGVIEPFLNIKRTRKNQDLYRRRHRLWQAFPKTHEQAVQAVSDPRGAASVHMDTVRSLDWLHQHGMCIDHIAIKESEVVPFTMGAYAKHAIPAGFRVAPVPLIQLSRRHLEIHAGESADDTWWKGHQLLLNYCYGHKDSTLLLFPYGPGINLINHATRGMDTEPNVALRWAKEDVMPNPKLLEMPVEEVLQANHETGLLMELYALRDLEPDEELYLDYGDDWQDAWNDHVDAWERTPLVHKDDYKSAWDFEINDEIYTKDEPNEYPPSYISVRCFVNIDDLGSPDDDGYYDWVATEETYIDSTYPCSVDTADYDDSGRKESYRISVVVEGEDEDEADIVYKIKGVSWDSITFVEKEYTGHQFLRQAFRHEILLPDDIFPENWKDLKVPKETEQCGLYMAESAIPNSGMGMYTARRIPAKEQIFSGDVVIQVEDYDVNQQLRKALLKNESTEEGDWLLDSYYWNPDVTLGHFEADDVESIVPGMGMLANSHPGLVNAKIEPPQITHDLVVGRDPGAGASSNYHNVRFIASQDIEAGEELFVKYGDGWFEQREDLGMVPLSTDFVRADALVNRFVRLVGEDGRSPFIKDAWALVGNLASLHGRLSSALPADATDMKEVAEKGTAHYSAKDRIRSIEWLEQNGRCLDNITPGESTNPDAGRGAFATRFLRAGDVIAPMPVVQIQRKDLEVYESEDYSDKDAQIRFAGYQQLMNYCYGHRESSLLLFPYSPVVNYVNNNAESPNAKLQWSTLPGHKKDWLDRTPRQIAREEHAGLIMELVATRDIEDGEEIVLDYGRDWNEEWREFNIDWFPEENASILEPISVLNEPGAWRRTEEELKNNPYPVRNATAICFVGRLNGPARDGFDWSYYEGIYEDPSVAHTCSVLSRDVSNLGDEDALDRKDSIKPVDIRYTVRLEPDEDEDHEGYAIVRGIPGRAIRFYNDPYTSDMFDRRAFRHEIGIPDEMVPSAWRDLKQ